MTCSAWFLASRNLYRTTLKSRPAPSVHLSRPTAGVEVFMPDWEHDEARIEAASQAVLKIPGVHSVYLGPRYRNGRKTGEMALCVLVRTKRPLEEVAPRDLVPPEVAGIPTDVIESDPPRPLQRLDSDDKYAQPSLADLPMFDDEEYTRLRGGIACEGGGGTGTLGCIARATDTANNGKIGRASCRERGVDLGGRRSIKKKKKKTKQKQIAKQKQKPQIPPKDNINT